MYLVSFDFYWPTKCGSHFCRILYKLKLWGWECVSAIGLNAVCRKCGQWRLRQLHRRQSWNRVSTLKNKGEDPAQTLINMYQNTRPHIQEDSILLKKTCSLSSSECNTKIFLINCLSHTRRCYNLDHNYITTVWTSSNDVLRFISQISPSNNTVLQNYEAYSCSWYTKNARVIFPPVVERNAFSTQTVRNCRTTYN